MGSGSAMTLSSGLFGSRKRGQCEHTFVFTDQPGVCAMCKKRIAHVRNLGYRCTKCGIVLDKSCFRTARGTDTTVPKDQRPTSLVFLEHFRLGNVEIVISTKGVMHINLNNFNIVLQHQIYSNELTEWSKVLKNVRKAYTSEILKCAPSYMLRGWGVRSSSKPVDLKENWKKQSSSVDESNEELTTARKEQLLLGKTDEMWIV